MHHWSKSHTSYGHAPMSSIHTCINTCTTGLKHIGRINMHYGSHPHTVNTSHITNRTPHTAIIYIDTISHTIWYSSQEQPQALAVQYSFLSIQTTWSQRIDNIRHSHARSTQKPFHTSRIKMHTDSVHTVDLPYQSLTRHRIYLPLTDWRTNKSLLSNRQHRPAIQLHHQLVSLVYIITTKQSFLYICIRDLVKIHRDSHII